MKKEKKKRKLRTFYISAEVYEYQQGEVIAETKKQAISKFIEEYCDGEVVDISAVEITPNQTRSER